MEKVRLAAAGITAIVALTLAAPAAAYCPPPVVDHAYQKDGETINVYRVPPGSNGEDCVGAAIDAVKDGNQGNSAGTASFELLPTSSEALADCKVRFVDGTSMAMRGLPRIRRGLFEFYDAQNRLTALPLKEVAATDSGRHFRCKSCLVDAAGRIVANPAVRAAFVAATACPANNAIGGSCPGYVVDHVTPLACGGEDSVANLQWEVEALAKRKEQWRVKACGS